MRAVIAALVLAAAGATAQAQDGKGYVGFGAGIGNYPDLCSQTPPGLSCDDAPFAWKFFAGYMFLPYIGIEGGFNDFGAANTQGVLLNPPPGTVPLPSNADVYTQVWSLSVVGRIPIGAAAIMGRVGYGSVMSKTSGLAQVLDTQTGAITNYDASTRGTTGQMIYGAGISWDFLPAWTARFDWDHSKGDDGTNPDYNVDMYTLGIAYRF